MRSKPSPSFRAPLPNSAPRDAAPAEPIKLAPINHEGPLPWVQLRNVVYHPSIFRKMLGKVDPKAKNGDLVTVYDREGKVFGTGLLSTQSQYGLRMLTFDATPADESLVDARIASAVAMRRDVLKLDAATNAYRVVHAEGDGLPGLIVDRFADYAVIEIFNYPMWRRAESLAVSLKKHLGVSTVFTRADERVQHAEGFVAATAGPTRERTADRKSTIISENGVKFQIDLTHGHKTGFFCDQRDNRRMLCEFTPEKHVLDLCSYSGGFGVYAATLGKAAHVTCVDLDEDAIALAKRNANINNVPRGKLDTAHSDVFPYMRQLIEQKKQFDVVVLDPPKLISNSDEFGEGRAKYFDLNKLALQTVKPGGILVTCSCSGLLSAEEFFSVLRGASRAPGRRVQTLKFNGPGADHPVMSDAPESAYLKCIFARVW